MNSISDDNLKELKYWREQTRNQLGFSIQLFIGFASAALAFMCDVMLSHESNDCVKFHFIFSSIFILISIITGTVAVINRLRDFRKTGKLYSQGVDRNVVLEQTKCIGAITWYLFIVQIITMLLGFILYIKIIYTLI